MMDMESEATGLEAFRNRLALAYESGPTVAWYVSRDFDAGDWTDFVEGV